jgi:hypothetical protein
MASGFSSIHPLMAKALQEIGIENDQITQGFGNAEASAGFHRQESFCKDSYGTHAFSSCVDLTWSLVSADLKSKLVEASFCPFFRNSGSFANNKHIHAVYVGAKDNHDHVTILAGPRSQIIDYTRGLNGLVGHAQLTGEYAPTEDEKKQIYKQYSGWCPHVATKIYSPEGNFIPSYAFYEAEFGMVRCEVPVFYDYWDVKHTITSNGYHFYQEGKEIKPIGANMRIEGENFLRGNIRQIANCIGLGVDFKWADDKNSCEVKLSYT